MITKISSGKNGQIKYHFKNGVVLSFIWDWGTYSDNHDDRRHMELIKNLNNPTAAELDPILYESKTVEIMSLGDNPNGIEEYLVEKYGDNPAGYVPVKDIPEILERAGY